MARLYLVTGLQICIQQHAEHSCRIQYRGRTEGMLGEPYNEIIVQHESFLMNTSQWPLNMYQSTMAKTLTNTNSRNASARTSTGMAGMEYFIGFPCDA